MVKKISTMSDKPFKEHGKKTQRHAMKEAKLVRRKIASEKGPHELTKQKMREKAHKHMKEHAG
jgi:hypothetical protein